MCARCELYLIVNFFTRFKDCKRNAINRVKLFINQDFKKYDIKIARFKERL